MLKFLDSCSYAVHNALTAIAFVVLLGIVPFALGSHLTYNHAYSLGLEAGRAIAATPRDLADYDCNWDYPSPRP